MEAVAQRVGVDKSPVYRRWGSLPNLLADAVDIITFDSATAESTGDVRNDLVDGIISASGCRDPRRQRIMSALLTAGKDQTDLVDALRTRFIAAIPGAMNAAVLKPTDTEWPMGSMDLAVVVGLLTCLPHITGHSLERADFEHRR